MALRELRILDTLIKPGSRHRLNLNTAKLYTTTSVEIPVIIERSRAAGPVVLICGGLHGDEINGVEIVRRILANKWNKPVRGTIICIPVMNIFGFLNGSRMFPDGRDLNRSFPGSKSGSLASRFAYNIVNEILPHVDIVLDFHTGGAQRFNAPQIRIDSLDEISKPLALAFNAPFVVESPLIHKTFRSVCSREGKIYLLYEGGKSSATDKMIIHTGVQGVLRVLQHLEMLQADVEVEKPLIRSIHITTTKWVRAPYSGLLHPRVVSSQYVNVGDVLAHITDPYGSFSKKVKSVYNGYVINVNQSPLVYQGDAIFHISTDGEGPTAQ